MYKLQIIKKSKVLIHNMINNSYLVLIKLITVFKMVDIIK